MELRSAVRRARGVEQGLCGQGRTGHSILVRPKPKIDGCFQLTLAVTYAGAPRLRPATAGRAEGLAHPRGYARG